MATRFWCDDKARPAAAGFIHQCVGVLKTHSSFPRKRESMEPIDIDGFPLARE
jgi:hypothetical protein